MISTLPSFDSVFFKNPAGVTTSYSIPNQVINISAHNAPFSKIINSVISLGYKVIWITPPEGFVNNSLPPPYFSLRTIYLSVPWSASGLEEVTATLKSFILSPNPANTFVYISLDYSLKGESEVVFISEAGYISHKHSIGNIYKYEKYNIDISKITVGKYLVTIVSGKTYTTPKKLIVL